MRTVGQEGPVGALLLRGLMVEPEDLPEVAGTPCFTNRVVARTTSEAALAEVTQAFAELGWFFWNVAEPLAEVDVCFTRPDEVSGRVLLTHIAGSELVMVTIRYDGPRLIPEPPAKIFSSARPDGSVLEEQPLLAACA